MSLHLNLSTGKFLNSSTLFKLSNALLLDVSSGEIVMSNLLVPRAGVDLFKLASLDLNFSQYKALTDRVSGKSNLITFSRASSGTYVDSDGLIKTSPVNSIAHSQDFSATNWANRRTVDSVTTETLDPLGGSTATKLLDTTDNATHRIDKILPAGTLSANTTYTLSVFAKQAEYSHVSLTIAENSNGNGNVIFDLNAGVKSSESAGYTGFIESAGGGWYRCIATVTLPSAVVSQNALIGLLQDASTISFAGTGTSSVYIWGAQLEEGSTASTYIPTTTTIGGAPRFDHDPVTGESLGLLIEESRTNFIVGSDTANGSGVGTPLTTSLETVISPLGVSESVRKLERTGSAEGIWRLGTTSGGTPNTTYSASVWVKTVNGGSTTFNLDINDSAPVGGLSITADGEWKRYVKVGGARDGIFRFFDINILAATEPIYIWGAQLEAGSFPTSYIPTTSSTVTRSPDIATIEGTNFSSWYNQSEGTVFAEAEASGISAIAGFDDGTAAERWRVGYAGANNAAMVVVDGGVVQTNINTSGNSTPYNQFHKLAGAIAVNNLSFVYNGTLTSDSSLSVPVVNALNLGKSIGVGSYLNGHISRLSYFPTRKTDQELVNMTS